MTTTTTTRLDELQAERLEIIEEKNQLDARVRQINASIKSMHPKHIDLPGLMEQRADLLKEVSELQADLAEVNQELKSLTPTHGDKLDMRNLVALVAAYIAAGDTRPTPEITRQALQDLAEITATAKQ